MAQLSRDSENAYVCKACGVEFTVPNEEAAVCCPVCRMNRIEPRD